MNYIDKLNADILEAKAKFQYDKVRDLQRELERQHELNKISEK